MRSPELKPDPQPPYLVEKGANNFSLPYKGRDGFDAVKTRERSFTPPLIAKNATLLMLTTLQVSSDKIQVLSFIVLVENTNVLVQNRKVLV